jgi:CO dehydrogenase nickel-insertion accessory protein CooC1
METARRVAELARELGVSDVAAVLNKVRNPDDRDAITSFCETHGLNIVGEIPYDASLAEAERSGRPPLDYQPAGPAVAAIRELANTLTAHS